MATNGLEDILNLFRASGMDHFAELEEYFKSNRRQLLKSLLTIYSDKMEQSIVDFIENYLREEQKEMMITDCSTLETFAIVNNTRISIWRGDITKLKVDAIVNAANSAMLGCFRINHPCIDNAIHCAAGPGLRNECIDFMNSRDNEPFPVGVAYLTTGYALPSKYVLHCVGPAAQYRGHEQPQELKSCYQSCLSISLESGDIHSIAFCCISTGVFGYPAEAACEVAMTTVKEWLLEREEKDREGEGKGEGKGIEQIIFDVFTESDWEIYQRLGRRLL